MDKQDNLLQFPCEFPVKVMGLRHERFVHNILEVVQRYVPDFPPEQVEMRPSSGGKYLSITCNIWAVSQDQVNLLYTALKAHPDVKVML